MTDSIKCKLTEKIKAYKKLESRYGDMVYEIHIDNIDSLSNYNLVRKRKP